MRYKIARLAIRSVCAGGVPLHVVYDGPAVTRQVLHYQLCLRVAQGHPVAAPYGMRRGQPRGVLSEPSESRVAVLPVPGQKQVSMGTGQKGHNRDLALPRA